MSADLWPLEDDDGAYDQVWFPQSVLTGLVARGYAVERTDTMVSVAGVQGVWALADAGRPVVGAFPGDLCVLPADTRAWLLVQELVDPVGCAASDAWCRSQFGGEFVDDGPLRPWVGP